jgi:hypothetical protein
VDARHKAGHDEQGGPSLTPLTAFLNQTLRRDKAACVAEQLFRILFRFPRNVRIDELLNVSLTEEDSMKKFGYVLAALGAIAIAAPSIASAETIVVKRGGYHHGYGARAEFREHRDHGWHRGWHDHDRVTVIKRHRY